MTCNGRPGTGVCCPSAAGKMRRFPNRNARFGRPENKIKTMRTQKALASLIACAIFALGTATAVQAAEKSDKKADATGTWTWTMQPRGGQGGDAPQPRKITLKLKAEGEKLTGSVTSPFGRRGGQGGDAQQPTPTEISDGKVKGDEVSFSVVREFNGNKFTQKYSGKLDGDTIKGKIAFERNGEAQSRDWEAKREKEAK
jgi:hypothetical protein